MITVIRTLTAIALAVGLLIIGADLAAGVSVPVVLVVGTVVDMIALAFFGRRS